MKRVGQLKRKRIGRDKYRARVYGGLPAGAAVGVTCLVTGGVAVGGSLE